MLTTIALQILSTSKPITWPVALAHLCAKPALFDQYVRGGDLEFRKWCHDAGLTGQPKAEEWGYSMQPTRVCGNSQSWVAVIDGAEISSNLSNALVLFSKRNQRLQGEVLMVSSNGLPMLPISAVISRQNLFLYGHQSWTGNARTAAAQVFQKSPKGWKSVSELESRNEWLSNSKLILKQGKASPEHLKIQTRSYPVHLSASHHAAWLEREELWQFRRSKIVRISDTVLDTPYAALDRLMGRIQRGDKSGVFRLCATTLIGERVWKLKTIEGLAGHIVFPNHASGPGQKKLGLRNANLWFSFARIGGNWKVSKLEPLPEDY